MGEGYLSWMGREVPTLDWGEGKRYLPWTGGGGRGYLPWTRGRGYLPWTGGGG